MPHGQMYSLAGLLIQFPQIGQAETADVKLPHGGLTDGETCDSEMMGTLSITVEKARVDQICQKAMNCAHREPRQTSNLLRRKSPREFAEKVQQAQPPLQSCNVVIPLSANCHNQRQK